MRLKNLFTAPICFFVYLFVCFPVFAQEFNLSITPPLLQVMMKQDKTITQVYKLSNNGSEIPVFIDIVPIEAKSIDGSVTLQADWQKILSQQTEKKADFLKWFSFQNSDIDLPGKFLLPERSEQTLVLKIKTPENAQEKDYYAALVFASSPPEEGSLNFSGIIAANILLTVSQSGQPAKYGSIVDFKALNSINLPFVNMPVFDSLDIIEFRLVAKNDSQTVFSPFGSVNIFSPHGKEITRIPILSQNILSLSKRQLFAADEETIKKSISWHPGGIKIGKYTATADLGITDSNNKLFYKTGFLILPVKTILGLMLAVILLIIVFNHIKKSNV